jgi:hypothetical protein
MADLNFPTAAAANFKPAPQMSLADMLNMARGAQAYQQSQQMNPLELQKAQAELSKYQAMSPLDIRKAAAETKVSEETAPTRIQAQKFATETAGVGSESAKMKFANEQTTAIANRLTPLINNPLIISAEQNPSSVDPTKLHGILNSYAQEQADALGIPKEKAAQLIQPYIDAASQNPAGMRQFLKDKLLTTLDQGSRATAMGGVGVSTAPVPAAAAASNVAPTNIQLKYPVRSGAQNYVPDPSETADKDAGVAYRQRLEGAQSNLSTARRNAQEVESQAKEIEKSLIAPKGGILGAVEQKIRMSIESEKYETLAKDLANMALTNSQALGQVGGTVAGLNMSEVANGTIKVPPEVLIKIARRVQADQTNIDLQANGARKFAQKFGDNNITSYRDSWNANADSKVFEAMNIFKNETDPVKRKNEIDKLLGSSPEKRKEFYDKYQNIKKLSETGSL